MPWQRYRPTAPAALANCEATSKHPGGENSCLRAPTQTPARGYTHRHVPDARHRWFHPAIRRPRRPSSRARVLTGLHGRRRSATARRTHARLRAAARSSTGPRQRRGRCRRWLSHKSGHCEEGTTALPHGSAAARFRDGWPRNPPHIVRFSASRASRTLKEDLCR
jgi:hypothetical protein